MSISVILDGKAVKGSSADTILTLCQREGIHIPTLCYHPDLCARGNCRVCLVEVKGARTLVSSCVTPLTEKQEIITASNRVRKARRGVIELLLSNHYTDCTSCARNLQCELQDLANEYGITSLPWDEKRERSVKEDHSSLVFNRDNNKCVLCGRCVDACRDLQGVSAIELLNRGDQLTVGSSQEKPISEVVCINCGQCVAHCPTGALVEKSHRAEVWDALEDPTKVVVVQTAPAIRAALGELFGCEPGTLVTGRMVAALRKLGFDYVFDTQFAADLTIIEEGYELLGRLTKALTTEETVSLPMMTSCSPGWIKYIEHFFPEQLEHVSSCKSPQQMFGALLKTYWADKMKISADTIVMVSVMPCTAKKFEASREEMSGSGYSDVDYVLTTREVACMIAEFGISLPTLEDEAFDNPLGESTGAGTIFGATGGVMEAALRSAYEIVTGREVPFKNLEIVPVRGLEGIREATIKIENCLEAYSFLEGVDLKVAIAHGTANAHTLMEQIENGTSPYHFIEIMTCPGGCLGGGGQPLPISDEIRKARARAIYEEDRHLNKRKSHENSSVMKLYDEFLGSPNSEKAHELLHTRYVKRGL